MVAKFGAKAASRGVPALAQKIEVYAARYGDETFLALRRVGPGAFEVVDSAGVNGVKAMRVLAAHGEAGAANVLKRPAAMSQFLRFGDDAAAVLVKHPGIAEQVVERGGLTAVKAMAAVGPQNVRRVAMLMEGELGRSAKAAELLEVIARYGDRGATFVWANKGALATGGGADCLPRRPGGVPDRHGRTGQGSGRRGQDGRADRRHAGGGGGGLDPEGRTRRGRAGDRARGGAHLEARAAQRRDCRACVFAAETLAGVPGGAVCGPAPRKMRRGERVGYEIVLVGQAGGGPAQRAISLKLVYSLVAQGRLRANRATGKLLIEEDSLVELMEGKPRAPPVPEELPPPARPRGRPKKKEAMELW